MPGILSEIIPSMALAQEVVFLKKKSKAEFVLTNLKTFGLRLSQLSNIKYYNYE